MRISDWRSDVCSSDLLCCQKARRSAGLARPPRASRRWNREKPNKRSKVSALGRVIGVTCRRERERGGAGGDDIARAAGRPDRPAGGCCLGTAGRSDGRRVGKECVSAGRSRWSPFHKKKK